MTRRRWIAELWDQTSATLTGAQALHLARVLRAQPGMQFDIVAGNQVWRAEVTAAGDNQVRFALLEQLDAEPALPITLLLAVFKFDRMEWAIEKATELGVARMVPVLARRTEKHLAQAAAARVERWRRIMQEAAKQSRRSDLATISDPITTRQACACASQGSRLLLSETEEDRVLADAVTGAREIAFAIGPEGGWTEEELTLFRASGWTSVSLGPRILRAETAAISAIAIASALLS